MNLLGPLASRVGLPVLVAVGGALWLLQPSASTASRSARLGATPERRELMRRLDEVRRVWRPAERERLVAAIAADVEDHGLKPPLRFLIGRGDHVLVGPAVEVARAAKVVEAVPELRKLLDDGPERERPGALRALHACAGLSADEVVKILRSEDRELQFAALETAATVEDFPWQVLLERLGADDPAIREAAAAAFPRTLPDDAVDRMLVLVNDEFAPQDLVDACDAVLAARVKCQDLERRIGLQLERLGADAKVYRHLRILEAKGEPLTTARDAAWRCALDTTAPRAVQAAAWRCLEHTHTPESGSDEPLAAEDVLLLDRAVRLFAGRYLLSMGRREAGGRVLYEVLQPEGEEPDAFSIEARRALCVLEGVTPCMKRGELQELVWTPREEEGVRPTVLPPVPVQVLELLLES